MDGDMPKCHPYGVTSGDIAPQGDIWLCCLTCKVHMSLMGKCIIEVFFVTNLYI